MSLIVIAMKSMLISCVITFSLFVRSISKKGNIAMLQLIKGALKVLLIALLLSIAGILLYILGMVVWYGPT